MRKKLDFLFEVECQTGYLSGTVKNLRTVLDVLYRNLLARAKDRPDEPLTWAVDYCDAIYAALRALERIQEELDVAVTSNYQEKWDKTAAQNGGGE